MATYSQDQLNSILASLPTTQPQGQPDYVAYVNNNPDLLAQFNAQTGGARGRDKAAYGQWHWSTSGSGEASRAYTPYGQQNTSPNQYISTDGQIFSDSGAMQQHNIDLQNQQLQSQKDAAVNRATTQANQSFLNAGLDPNSYSSNIQSQIQSILAGIPQGDTDPAGYFPQNLGDTIIGNLQSQARSQYGNQVNQAFTPNYDTTQIGNDFLSQQINDILTQQSKGASDALDRAKARGQINDTGYAGGQATFNNERTSALSQLNSIANDVLTGYRSKLDDVANSARTAASGYQLGGSFNLNDYLGKANDVVNSAKSNAGGDLITQLGGKNFFDINQILGNAGQAQGAVNLQNKDVIAGLDNQSQTNNQKRGLGSQGAF